MAEKHGVFAPHAAATYPRSNLAPNGGFVRIKSTLPLRPSMGELRSKELPIVMRCSSTSNNSRLMVDSRTIRSTLSWPYNRKRLGSSQSLPRAR